MDSLLELSPSTAPRSGGRVRPGSVDFRRARSSWPKEAELYSELLAAVERLAGEELLRPLLELALRFRLVVAESETCSVLWSIDPFPTHKAAGQCSEDELEPLDSPDWKLVVGDSSMSCGDHVETNCWLGSAGLAEVC